MALAKWLSDGCYLPPWLRDFHAQKDLFKWIWSQIPDDRKADPTMGGMSWVAAHVFTIDFFLWFMARHGWTLQRSRAACAEEFKDIHESVGEYRKELVESFAKIMAERKKPAAPKASDE